MSKKSFTGGLSSLLESSTEPVTKPRKISSIDEDVSRVASSPKNFTKAKLSTSSNKKSARVGTRDGALRMTFILNEDVCNKIRALAFYDREPIGEMLEEILKDYLSTQNPKTLEQALLAYKKSSS